MLNAIKEEEKMIYRIVAQREHMTITADTVEELTMDEAEKTAIANVLGGVNALVGLKPFVALPITTKERWDAGKMNFCPRCGTNLSDCDLEETAYTDCSNCDVSLEVHIQLHDEIED